MIETVKVPALRNSAWTSFTVLFTSVLSQKFVAYLNVAPSPLAALHSLEISLIFQRSRALPATRIDVQIGNELLTQDTSS